MKSREFAIKWHGDQKYGDHPYVKHLDDVYAVANEFINCIDFYEVCANIDDVYDACYLHDILEDTKVSYGELYMNFSWETVNIIQNVTDEPGPTRKIRKRNTWHKIRSSSLSTFVKLCDRIANVQNSKKNNPQLFKMYQKEFPLFEAALYNPRHDFDKIWDVVRKLHE